MRNFATTPSPRGLFAASAAVRYLPLRSPEASAKYAAERKAIAAAAAQSRAQRESRAQRLLQRVPTYKSAPSNLPCKSGIATAVGTLTPAVWYCPAAAARCGAPESRSGGRPGLSAALVGTAAQAELGVREAEHGRRARTRSPIQHQKHSDADRIPRGGRASEQRVGCRYDDTLATIRRALSTQRVRARRGGGHYLFRSR